MIVPKVEPLPHGIILTFAIDTSAYLTTSRLSGPPIFIFLTTSIVWARTLPEFDFYLHSCQDICIHFLGITQCTTIHVSYHIC